MRALEWISMMLLGSVGAWVFVKAQQKHNVKRYLENLMTNWIIKPSPKKVPIKKLAILVVETSKYVFSKTERQYVTPATEIVKAVADSLDYTLTKKQWSKVRIEARKLVKKPQTALAQV